MFSTYQNTSKWIQWRNMWWSSSSINTTQGIPQHHDGLSNHVARHITPRHKKIKGVKHESNVISLLYSSEQNGKDKCWKCGRPHKKQDCLHPPQAITPNPNFTQPSSHDNTYGHDLNHFFTLHSKLQHGQSQTTNVEKGQGFGKIQKGKNATNKGLTPN